MRMPRKAILIRLAIYVPLLAYFGWQAIAHLRAEREAKQLEDEAPERVELADPFEGMPTKTIDVDGKRVKVYEITPEQAEAYLGVKQDQSESTGSGSDG